MYLRNNVNIKKVLIIMLIISIFFPYSFQGIRIAGIILTVERLTIPIILLYCFHINKGKVIYEKNSVLNRWIFFLLCWISLGIILIFFSDYVSIKSGVKEVLSLVYGIVLLFILSILIKNKDELGFSFRIIRALFVFLVLFGIMEILTGVHFVNSIYHNEEAMYLKYISRGLEINNRMATGFLYGVNDFASFLGVFSPFLFVKNKTASDKILNLVTLGLYIVILIVNDANIVLMAAILGEFVYIFFSMIKSNFKKKIYSVFGIVILLTILICLYCILGGKIELSNGMLYTQLENYQLNQGSLFSRITIYKDAFLASLKNYFIGYGPASFINYFTQHKSLSGLVNPHALVFEILFNYGGLVLLVFSWLVYILIKKNLVLYIHNKEKKNLIVLVSVIIYVLVSFSPSSFLAYSYQWVVLGLSCLAVDLREVKNE